MITLSLVAGLSLLAVTVPAAAHYTSPDNVFDTDRLHEVFEILNESGCLTPDFDYKDVEAVSDNCMAIIANSDGFVTNCAGASPEALFVTCASEMLGTTSADGTFFNDTLFEQYLESFTSYSDWVNVAKQEFRTCDEAWGSIPNTRQQVVFDFICWFMKMTSKCDNQQDQGGALAEEGVQRRVRFLAGSYTLSPITLVTDFGLVTEDTWDKCTTFTAYATDVTSRYEAELGRVVCLLQDFTSPDGTIDFDKLTTAISGTAGKAGNTAVNKLLNLVEGCKSDDDLASTAEEFAKCWAASGVESRAFPEARKLASTLPETCTILTDYEFWW